MIREDTTRLGSPKMEFYREIFKNSPRWNGSEPLHGKHLVVYCEQGLGDQIQFMRYIPKVKERYPLCRITLHCSQALHRLLEKSRFDAMVLNRDEEELPEHDYHITSLSLPFALQEFDADSGWLLDVGDRKQEIHDHLTEHAYKIGIAWEGNPDHSNNEDRCCYLTQFAYLKDKLMNLPRPVHFFSLQKDYHNPKYINTDDLCVWSLDKINDMLDTARAINSMDAIVTVDTSILHLAGTIGKPTWGLLSHAHDPRWTVRQWYPSVTLVRQPSYGDWKSVMDEVGYTIREIIRC